MRSHGTKETQGINGDASVLQRMLNAAAAAFPDGGPAAPCPYSRHRGSDWQLTPDHPIVCGVCHPPAAGIDDRRKAIAIAEAGET